MEKEELGQFEKFLADPKKEEVHDARPLGKAVDKEIFFVWWQSRAGSMVTDRDGCTDWEPDYQGAFVVWDDQRFDYPDRHSLYESAELAVTRNLSIPEAIQVYLAEKEAEERAEAERRRREAEARRLDQESFPGRMRNPQTPEDKKRREELLDVLRRYGSYFGSSQPPHAPHALPYLYASSHDEAKLRGLISEQEAEAMGVRRGYIHDGQFSCPFCGKLVKKNEPCGDCLPRVATDYDYEQLKNLQWDPFRESWTDVVKRHWRLRQYQCSCGRWADTPVCPHCQERLERIQAPAKLKAALRTWVGRRVKVEIILVSHDENYEPLERVVGPITLCDTMTGVAAKRATKEGEEEGEDEDENEYFRINRLLLNFSTGSTLKTEFLRVLKVTPKEVELEWELAGKYSPEEHLRLTLIGGDEG